MTWAGNSNKIVISVTTFEPSVQQNKRKCKLFPWNQLFKSTGQIWNSVCLFMVVCACVSARAFHFYFQHQLNAFNFKRTGYITFCPQGFNYKRWNVAFNYIKRLYHLYIDVCVCVSVYLRWIDFYYISRIHFLEHDFIRMFVCQCVMCTHTNVCKHY